MTTETAKNKSDQQRKTNQIFNIAERPVMDFISAFLEEPNNVIFKDDSPTYIEPLILLPMHDYKEGVCIKFTIKPINLSEERTEQPLSINSVIEHPKVKEGIGFLWYCVKEAYTAIVATAMFNNKPLSCTSMDLNETDWVFYPKYASELTHKKNFLENALGKLMYIKKNISDFPPEMSDEIIKEFPRIEDQLKDVNSKLTPEIIMSEKTINDTYTNKAVLGIFIEEILESDLPKPILSESDEKNNTIVSKADLDTYDIEQNVTDLFISE